MRTCPKWSFCAVLFASVVASPFAQPTTPPLTSQSLYAKTVDSVVQIECETAEGKVSGTGFFYKGKEKVVTCYHVLEGATSILIKGTNGKEWKPKAIYTDKATDMATLVIEGDAGRDPLGSKTFSKIAIGEEIFVLGNPLGLNGSFTKGIVSAKRTVKEKISLVQIDAAISEGSSGSPILSKEGEVLGVVSFYFKEGQSLNMGVAIDAVDAIQENARMSAETFYEVSKLRKELTDLKKTGKSDSSGSEGEDAVSAERVKVNKAASAYHSALLNSWLKWTVVSLRNMGEDRKTEITAECEAYQKCLTEFEEVIVQEQAFEAANNIEDEANTGDKLKELCKSLLKVSKEYNTRLLKVLSDGRRERYDESNLKKAVAQLVEIQDTHLKISTLFKDQVWYHDGTFYEAMLNTVYAFEYNVSGLVAYPDPDVQDAAIVGAWGGDNSRTLKPGDKITGVRLTSETAFTPVKSWLDIVNFIVDNPDLERAVVAYERDGKKGQAVVKTKKNES